MKGCGSTIARRPNSWREYGFEATNAWLDHLRLASVKFGSGGSAEFVSPEGLILSNHHVGFRALQRLSTPEHNFLRDGYYARTRAEERPCPGIEVRVLMNIEDVTARVNAAVAAACPMMPPSGPGEPPSRLLKRNRHRP